MAAPTQTPPGTLYLVPAPLDFGCKHEGQAVQTPLADILPASTLHTASHLRHWVVENAKSARALLGRINASHPLICPIQEMAISEMPRIMHKKGDALAATLDPAALTALLEPLREGHDMGLLSEAGMPAVADPGAALVRAAHGMGVRVLPLVGPSSLLLALAASGLNGQNFTFVGYLPQEPAARDARIHSLQAHMRKSGQSQICIETPYRNAALWRALLANLAPDTQLAISAGLTLVGAYSASRSVADWRKGPPLPEGVLDWPCIFTFGL